MRSAIIDTLISVLKVERRRESEIEGEEEQKEGKRRKKGKENGWKTREFKENEKKRKRRMNE